MSQNDSSKSLNKYISDSGLCSRRQADALIEEGRVTLNGKIAKKGNRVLPSDEVSVDGDLISKKKAKPIYIAFNKPIGIECTTNRNVNGNIIDFIKHEQRIFPIGRLDKDSEGLILLTNDGDIVNTILRAENKHEKEYIVEVDKNITREFIKQMGDGVTIMGKVTNKCKVEKLGKKVFSIVLTQGWNRQIRRMCTELGYKVKSLQRVRIMHIKLGELPLGRWRRLNHVELTGILEKAK
ncbi:MAG: pseudouridine synthase [Bacteroidetes bacterium]|nr:pseudouridine synthase [Bacteroidota bacterium]